jgi:hypothetical protein
MDQVGRKAFGVLLSGVTVGFVFAMYIGLGFANDPHLLAIGGIGTAVALYVCMERLFDSSAIIFTGCLYLSMVGALCTAAVASQFPPANVLPIALWEPSLYMIAILTAMLVISRVYRWILNSMVGRTGDPDGQKQPGPPQSQEESTGAQIQAPMADAGRVAH